MSEYVKARTASDAVKQMPWAKVILHLEGGYLGFDSQTEADSWKESHPGAYLVCLTLLDPGTYHEYPWTYEGYRRAVIGDRSPLELVQEFDLDTSDQPGLDEWLGHAEAEAWRVGCKDNSLMELRWPPHSTPNC